MVKVEGAEAGEGWDMARVVKRWKMVVRRENRIVLSRVGERRKSDERRNPRVPALPGEEGTVPG